jgi:hypothetical protein
MIDDKKTLYYPPNDWYALRRDQNDGYGGDNRPLVFLAGPILGADDWQAKAVELIHGSNPDIVISNPRRPVWEKDNIQVMWETNHLRISSAYGGILFWLAKETTHIPERAFAQTTRFELAEWITHYKYRKLHQPDNTIKIALGIDDDFPGRSYILERIFDDCPEFVVATTLEETCQLMIEKLK